MARTEKQIRIPIPAQAGWEDWAPERLAEHFQSNIRRLYEGLARECEEPRAWIDPDNITILEAWCEGDKVTLRYEFSWDAYYGCRDMNTSGVEEDVEDEGQRAGNEFVFLEWIPNPPRDTVDEF